MDTLGLGWEEAGRNLVLFHSLNVSLWVTYSDRNECDLLKTGGLNRESFVRGMWRIDEELRRAQTDPLKHPPSVNPYSSKSRGVARRQTKAILT